MAKTETIIAALPELSLEELDKISEAITATMQSKALDELHAAEVHANTLRTKAGFKTRPLTKMKKPYKKRATSKASSESAEA